MLLAYKDFVLLMDPDVIEGYNIYNFDEFYLYERADELGILDEFMDFGRIKNIPCKLIELNLSSAAMGDNKFNIVEKPGRI